MKQFEEKGAQVMGLSADPRNGLRTWANSLGGITHPLLSDFWPHGETLRKLDVFNEENGQARRSLFIIDKEGIIRFRQTYEPGVLPDPSTIIEVVQGLNK